MGTIKTALVSVYDKTGIADFCRELHKKRIEIISSGGTSAVLKDAGIPVTEVSKYTKTPEILDGRVKTLHPKIYAGLLALRKNKKHLAELKALSAKPIDLVVVNLYPFEQKLVQASGIRHQAVSSAARDARSEAESTSRMPNAASHKGLIETIDIGGPTLIRAAAKNYDDVTVVTKPQQYEGVLSEISKKGSVSQKLNETLAAEAFNYVAHYDALIDLYFQAKFASQFYPEYLNLTFKKMQDLRYGENPNQKAAFYKNLLEAGGLGNAVQLHGKQLSYNNLLDMDAAWNTVNEFNEPTVVIVKHTNPCGVASAQTLKEAFKFAYDSDPLSVFGGIIAANRKVEIDFAKELMALFFEEIIAPDYSDEALALLRTKKDVRVMKADPSASGLKPHASSLRTISAGLLAQTPNFKQVSIDYLKKVTNVKPTKEQLCDLLFAWSVCKYVKSNAIVLAKNSRTVGIGAGQMSRIDSVRIAVDKSKGRAPGSVMASDAFFPFRDSVDLAADAGISAIIQPGGSIRDKEVIQAANERGVAMVLTGVRVFRH